MTILTTQEEEATEPSVWFFVDPDPEVTVRSDFQELFEEFGCEAYFAIQSIREQEHWERYGQYYDYWFWRTFMPLDPDHEEIDDEEMDLGPDEPDEFGLEAVEDDAAVHLLRQRATFRERSLFLPRL